MASFLLNHLLKDPITQSHSVVLGIRISPHKFLEGNMIGDMIQLITYP